MSSDDKIDRRALILQAVLRLLTDHGISGVSMRAVAAEAGVALGLVNYHFDNKTSLIAAALQQFEQEDLAIVTPDPHLPPGQRLSAALRRVVDAEFLTQRYLSLRLQLWSLAQAHDDFAELNSAAQRKYRAGLAELIAAARPDLSSAECDRRAEDISIVQNGMWLTALLGIDHASIHRGLSRTEAIALAG